MIAFAGTIWFGVLLSLTAWVVTTRLARVFRTPLMNPVLLSVVGIIGLLTWADIPYGGYNVGGSWLSFFLGPAVVALAVPLYRQMDKVQANLLPVAVALTVAAVVGIVSAVVLVLVAGGSMELALSMAPKSVTTPIALGVSRQVGGVPELTVALVIMTGIIGAVVGPEFLRLLRLGDSVPMGLAVGASAHGIGTARALEEDPLAGAMSGIAMTVNGLLTATLMPYILPPLLAWLQRLGLG